VTDCDEPASIGEQLQPAIRSVIVLTVLAGCVFPLVLFGIARPLFPRQAGGTLIRRNGVVVGSEWIGQSFTHPEYFQPRPSAAGNGYDATSSGGANFGPNHPKWIAAVRQAADEYRRRNGLAADATIPIDAVTASASGLDPDISPENAELQIARVAHARHLTEDMVRSLVAAHTQGPQFGFLGSPRVRVLDLNLALDEAGAH
jgi:K+-transporting ATPase ATPase C chain